MSPLRFLLLTACLILLSFRPASAVLCHPEDREVLLRIKAELNNPYLLASWNTSITFDCCYWYCLKCDVKTHRVVELFFLKDGLPGQIPPSIGDLTYLRELTLHHLPNITGTIPSSLTKLKYLSSLWLDYMSLSGNIPSFLGQLKNLTYLNLSFNKFTGHIPTSITSIPGLGTIDLSRNQLTGTIPASIANLKGNSLYLLLSHNNLSGTIPPSFADIDFGKLDLSRNKLEGDASPLFGPTKSTYYIDISRNLFEFDLSNLVVNNSLTYLDLNHNEIDGNIPAAFTNLELQFLNVSYNRLCGQIPVGGKLQSFDYSVYFHNRCLCGAPLDPCK